MTVLGLPAEILSSILSYLPITDLLQAAKTCHGFHSAADVAYKRNRLSQIGVYDFVALVYRVSMSDIVLSC